MTNEQIQALKAADAIRISACVTACEGISTENLVNNVPLKQGLTGLNQRIRDAETQRDELLAAHEADKALIAEQANIIAKLERALDLARNSNSVLAIRSELEARTLTVKLPKTIWYEHDDLSRDVAVLEKRLVKKALREACAAAGTTLKVGGE